MTRFSNSILSVRNLFLVLLLCLVVIPSGAVSPEALEEAMSNLDEALARREEYIDRRKTRIDSLKFLLAYNPVNINLIMAVADEYNGFQNDSAITYYFQGERLAQTEKDEFRWKRAAVMSQDAFLMNALQIYYSIDSMTVPENKKASFYNAGRQIHSNLAEFYAKYPPIAHYHRQEAVEYQRRMISAAIADSSEYKFRLGEFYFDTGRIETAEIILEEFVRVEPAPGPLRARAAYCLAAIADTRDDVTARNYYLALSALSDVETASLGLTALRELGTAVYATGDVDRAFVYLNAALMNALYNDDPLRMIQMSEALPIIMQTHTANISSLRFWTYCLVSIIVVLLAFLVLVLVFLRRERRKIAVLQSDNSAANKAKEVYISRFLQLCSIYMDKINQFCKVATRKLVSGQSDELLRMVRSGKFVEEHSAEFYEAFDNTFLLIYPDFVARVNELLRPDAQLEPEPGMRLNTGLRILAFMRLGVDDSAQIARILNYSLNTIYSYRNRLKARAIDRDSFESDIMRIQ